MMNKKNKKIGLFFGSFNPIHTGHLLIASYMHEYSDLDEVWFVVSPQNPLKNQSSLLPENHRYYMVNMAVENDSRFKVSNIEFGLPKPSYTINTLMYLEDKYPNNEFILISGSDIFPTFKKWKNYDILLQNYKFYVYPRPQTADHEMLSHPSIKLIDAPQIDISSTFIRNAIKNKKNCKYFLPEEVYNYILEMNFYKK